MLTLAVLLTPAIRSELERLLQERTTVSVDIAWRAIFCTAFFVDMLDGR